MILEGKRGPSLSKLNGNCQRKMHRARENKKNIVPYNALLSLYPWDDQGSSIEPNVHDFFSLWNRIGPYDIFSHLRAH